MSGPEPKENLMSLGDRILWGMQQYKATEQGIILEVIPVESLGRPNTRPPTVVDQANLRLLAFTVDTDSVSFKFPIPWNLVSGSDLELQVVWTNDGGVDDNEKNVKVQMDYQISSEGTIIDGSHENSPQTIEDTYIYSPGWTEHRTGFMTIPSADFAGGFCVFIKLSFVTAQTVVLTGEPHLIGVCLRYTAHKVKTG